MDFDLALSQGYYFDRAIDLYFYDGDKKLLGILKTPERGMKPAITVKGMYIEGSYAISSYISVQNMSYTIDVNSVAYIDCQMYYMGLRRAWGRNARSDYAKFGHSVLFSVLYADQEKEPPNRAVRFQCTVAAQDRNMFDIPVNIDTTGGKLDVEIDENSSIVVGGGSKEDAVNAPLLELLKKLAVAYNHKLTKGQTAEQNVVNNKMLIGAISCSKKNGERKVKVNPKTYRFGEILRKLNCLKTSGHDYCDLKVALCGNTLDVSTIVPDDWDRIAYQEGFDTPEKLDKFYRENFLYDDKVTTYLTGEAYYQANKEGGGQEQGTLSNPIRLNYVKAAFRTENVVQMQIVYDDRIRPGSYVLIRANAIMGKQMGRGAKSGSRLYSLTNRVVMIRVTGGVEFEFSTVEDSVMTLIGPVVNDDYTGNAGSIYR